MLSKFNVLLVEDDPDKRNQLKVALELAGYNVQTANDGVEGLQAVEAHQPDLIIAEVMMPRMDGYEMVRKVRANPSTRFIPIIIQTAARSAADDVRRGADAGALGYITDPTDLDLLLARARTLLDFKSYIDACEEAAFTDHLTGLANRRRFERQLEREIARSVKHGTPFGLLMLDIDHFKRVNDTYGHDAGDEALRRVGRLIQSELKGIDTPARYGGEEFIIILSEADLSGARTAAERIRHRVEQAEFSLVGRITASFGLAVFPRHGVSADRLIEAADKALYEAKSKGRNRVSVAS